ncbi:leucine-rich repeat domain-containing protein [Candidatus Paracaedibacter symbiosus]|uniref:leucine-rich repeat domain-containing protein n=1 Tax=Candidatus Paracaedibacter symbiosus TaxID=244582 RepID=UPI0005097E39|nr:leucine-rich repeat domain-containing protein [Candidatus Paracaedibacter symbiosus]
MQKIKLFLFFLFCIPIPVSAMELKELEDQKPPLVLKGELFEKDIESLQEPSKEIYLVNVYHKDKTNKSFLNRRIIISPDVINFQSLIILSIGGGGLTDAHIKEIHNFKFLKKLSLSGNCITDEGVYPIVKLTELEELNLSGNKISDVGTECLSYLPHLIFLDLSLNDDITDTGITRFRKHTKLKELIIEHTKISYDMYDKLREKMKVKFFPGPGVRPNLRAYQELESKMANMPNTAPLQKF